VRFSTSDNPYFPSFCGLMCYAPKPDPERSQAFHPLAIHALYLGTIVEPTPGGKHASTLLSMGADLFQESLPVLPPGTRCASEGYRSSSIRRESDLLSCSDES
jgi:hypothetical protein